MVGLAYRQQVHEIMDRPFLAIKTSTCTEASQPASRRHRGSIVSSANRTVKALAFAL